MSRSDVIQKALAILENSPSVQEAAEAVSSIQDTVWDLVRTETGRHHVRWDLLSISEFLGTSSTTRHATRRNLAHGMVEVLEPLAALEVRPDNYRYHRQESYLIERVTSHLVEKLRSVRNFYPLDEEAPYTPAPIQTHFLLTEAADLMISHAVHAIIRQTMRSKFMVTNVYGTLVVPMEGGQIDRNEPFAAVAKQFMPRFRANGMEVAVAWNKLSKRQAGFDIFEMEGETDMERTALDIVRAMHIEAKIFGVYLPENLDLNIIPILTQVSRKGLQDSLKDIANAVNHEDGEPYLRRMLERITNRSVPMESDLVMLAAMHMPEDGERLPIFGANGSCIGSCRSRQEMLSVRSILAGELQRLPNECLDILMAHMSGDRLEEDRLLALLRLSLELVISLSRARFEPEVDVLERGLANIDDTGRIEKMLDDRPDLEDIDEMIEILLEALNAE